MSPPTRRLTPALLVLIAPLALVACSGRSTAAVATATQAPVATEAPVAIATPLPTATPSATATVGPPPTPTPTGGLLFQPARISQGGTTIVYLDADAAAATAKFQGRQYPMLLDSGRWWTIVGVDAHSEPGLHPLTVSFTPTGEATTISVVASIAVLDRDFPIERIDLDPETAVLLAPEIIQAELAQRAAIFSGYTAQRFWSGSFVAPGEGAISSAYGQGRSYNGGPVTDFHRGTDFVGDIGAPVVAAADGRVVFTGALRVRGNAIIIDHGAGVFSAYHHLSSIDVIEGEIVSAGATIGAIGSTGLVTGPHLHWELVIRGVEVDGELWLTGVEIAP